MEGVDHLPRGMMYNDGLIVHDAVAVLMCRGDVWCEGVRKRVKLDRAGQGCPDLGMSVGGVEGAVVMARCVFPDDMLVLRRERDRTRIMMALSRIMMALSRILMVLSRSRGRANQEHGNGA